MVTIIHKLLKTVVLNWYEIMINNPILPGFNPDPCIIRCDDDYYIATSTFEWYPGIAIYHSHDLVHWKLFTHGLQSLEGIGIERLSSSNGIWAPSLSFNSLNNQFYLAYSLMISRNARYFDVENYFVTSDNIKGSWSEPIYLNSIGFDPDIFHDKDGKSYYLCLEWELRGGEGRADPLLFRNLILRERNYLEIQK